MSIHRLLQNPAFTPEQIQAMGKAFDETLASLGVQDRDDPIVDQVAQKIIETAQEGESDPDRLREEAILAFTRCWH